MKANTGQLRMTSPTVLRFVLLITSIFFNGDAISGYGGMGSEYSDSLPSGATPMPDGLLFGMIVGGVYMFWLAKRNSFYSVYEYVFTLWVGACIGGIAIGLPVLIFEIVSGRSIREQHWVIFVLGIFAILGFLRKKAKHQGSASEQPDNIERVENSRHVPPRRVKSTLDTNRQSRHQQDRLPVDASKELTHEQIAKIAVTAQEDPNNLRKSIVCCPNCGQKLRVPSFKKLLSVKCQRCTNEFLATTYVWPQQDSGSEPHLCAGKRSISLHADQRTIVEAKGDVPLGHDRYSINQSALRDLADDTIEGYLVQHAKSEFDSCRYDSEIFAKAKAFCSDDSKNLRDLYVRFRTNALIDSDYELQRRVEAVRRQNLSRLKDELRAKQLAEMRRLEIISAAPERLRLMSLVRQNKVDRVRRLITEKPDLVLAHDSEGNTALHLAADNGSTELIQLLIEYGANTAARNAGGRTPLEIANRRDPKLTALFSERNEVEGHKC